MNEETKKLRDDKLRDIVERATAAADNLPDDLDAETASLRDAWLHLGKLIERDVRSNEVHACNGQSCGHRSIAPVSRVRLRRALRRRELPVTGGSRRSRIWLAALAASLLIAVGTTLALRPRSAPHQPPSASPPIASSEVPANKPAGPTAVPAVAPTPVPARNRSDAKIAESGGPSQHGEPVKWGDSVDDEITAISQAAIYVRQDDSSSRLWEIQTGLDQLNREVEHGHL